MTTTTSIAVEETPLVLQLLCRADDALILGHRLSEWTGHAPMLEEELALANIALDLIGQARSLYGYAGTLTGHTEDQLAYLRDAPAWRNCLMVELPNGDFAFSIARLLLVSAFTDPFWRAAIDVDRQHDRRHRRQGGEGDRLSPAARRRMADPARRRHGGKSPPRAGPRSMICGPTPANCSTGTCRAMPISSRRIRRRCATPGMPPIDGILARATLERPADGWMQSGGRSGRHTEHLGHLLAEMQFLQRSLSGCHMVDAAIAA